jgi:hypothetical protein
MKTYGSIYLKVYLVMHIIFVILSFIVLRRADITYPFLRLEIAAILVSGVVSFAIFMFRLEKGNTILNIIFGYLILIPSIFMLRTTFGQYLFRFTWIFYVLMVLTGIIYGIAVWSVSKKYQKEVKELNELLDKQNNKLSL